MLAEWYGTIGESRAGDWGIKSEGAYTASFYGIISWYCIIRASGREAKDYYVHTQRNRNEHHWISQPWGAQHGGAIQAFPIDYYRSHRSRIMGSLYVMTSDVLLVILPLIMLQGYNAPKYRNSGSWRRTRWIASWGNFTRPYPLLFIVSYHLSFQSYLNDLCTLSSLCQGKDHTRSTTRLHRDRSQRSSERNISGRIQPDHW